MSALDPKQIKDVLNKRKREMAELEDRANHAANLSQEVESIKKDLARFEDKQAKLAALGDEKLQVEQKVPYPGLGVIEFEPVRSRYSGAEMAAALQGQVDHLRSEITSREKTIKDLLAKSK
jgi:hypothetical protein